jgi:hypothetical protein
VLGPRPLYVSKRAAPRLTIFQRNATQAGLDPPNSNSSSTHRAGKNEKNKTIFYILNNKEQLRLLSQHFNIDPF